MNKLALPILILFTLALIGCGASQKPVLYPNSHLKAVGNAQAQRDIDDCMQTSEAYVKKNQESKIAEGAVKGGAVGAASGAAIGAVTGNFGRGLATGAAGGAAGGATYGAFKTAEPSPVFKNFVNKCLKDKGYEPMGWQ
ncbi:MAG TPA: YMGG-like glycine zipper-containing protein [Syntrophales bacterium]|nr:YMGG-like glycine zipper-containing protein [Syntrophales bacterium]